LKAIEIACCNLESVINANKGGASRIELFENLSEGGCTPSYGMMKRAREISKIPIYAMIRPRAGGFRYSKDELGIMCDDIKQCLDLNLDGIVFGILTERNEVDIEACSYLLETWKNRPATFHRAYDCTKDKESSVNTIAQLGFERILTSGGKVNAIEGKEDILSLHRKFGNQISFMAGSGVLAENVHLFSELNEVHATCKVEKISNNLMGSYSYSALNKIINLRKNFI